MSIDRTELMDLSTLRIPDQLTPELADQIRILKQLAFQPDRYRFVFFHMPADLRLHCKWALRNFWQKHEVQSVNMSQFIQQLVESIHNGNWLADLKKYEDAPILLADDFQLITGKFSTQEIFYSVLKTRLEKGLLTVLFSEYSYPELRIAMRDDLRNLLCLGIHDVNE